MVLFVAPFFALDLPLIFGARLLRRCLLAVALTLVGFSASFFGPTLNRLKMPLSLDGCATGGGGVGSSLDGAILPS